MNNFPKGEWKPPVFPPPQKPSNKNDGVTASSYVPGFKFLDQSSPLNKQPSANKEMKDLWGRTLKYPANTFVRQPEPPQKEKPNELWIKVGLGSIVLFLCLLFSASILPEETGRSIVAFCFYILVPAFLVCTSVFFIQVFIFTRPEKPKPEPPMSRIHTSFFHFIAQGVLQEKEASTFTGAIEIARQLTPSSREKHIEKIFEDKTAYLKVFLKVQLEEGMLTRSYLELRIGRSLNLMAALERGVLKALFMLYNKQLISEQEFRYCLTAIVWANGKATIESLTAEGLDNVAALKDRHTAMSDSELINWAFGQNNINHEQALSRGMALTDDLHANNPEDTTIQKVRSAMRSGGKWFKKEDIEKSIYTADVSGPYSLYLGNLEDGTPLGFDSNESILTIAPPGSGKTQTFVIPNLLRWQGPAIVLDIKGELYHKTAGYRSTIGPVYKLDIFSDDSHGFNPFDHLSDDFDTLWEETRFLVSLMFLRNDSKGDNFWDDSAIDLLRSILTAMIMDEDNKNRSLNYILDKISSTKKVAQVEHVMRSIGNDIGKREADNIADLREKDEGTSNLFFNVRQTLKSQLGKLEGTRIINATSRKDWNPKQLREENGTVYIKLKPGSGKDYSSLMRLILGLHMRELTVTDHDNEVKPFLFMLDEMPDLGRMELIEQILNMGRSSGLRLWMFSQDRDQLRRNYDNAGALASKCAVQILMDPQLADGVAQEISSALGNKESLADGRVEPVLTPVELAGPDYGSKSFVFGKSAYPAIVTREMAWQSDLFNKRMAIPAPSKPSTKKNNPIPPKDIPDFIKKGKKL